MSPRIELTSLNPKAIQSLIGIEAIVNAFAFLYGQPARGWSFEVDVRTSRERW